MGTKDNSTPEGMAAELNESFEESKARAEARTEASNIPEKPGFGAGSETTDDGTGSRW